MDQRDERREPLVLLRAHVDVGLVVRRGLRSGGGRRGGGRNGRRALGDEGAQPREKLDETRVRYIWTRLQYGTVYQGCPTLLS